MVRDSGALVVALASSLSDVGTAASLVAAGDGDAVLLAESTDSMGAAASKAAARWQPERVLIVGGVRAVAESVENELRRLSAGVRITRLAGDDRIQTAALAADRVLEGSAPKAVIIANGWSLPDVGVAASAVASGAADAVLYASGDELGEPTRSVLARHGPRLVLIAGGPAALASEVQSQAAATAGGAESRRLGGATRVETAALVARDAIGGGATSVVVANGWSLPDVGLAAALAAALPNSAAVYTEGSAALGDASEQAIGEGRLERILLVGDETSLGVELREQLAGSADTVTRVTSPIQAFYDVVGIEAPPRFTAITAGNQNTCALRADKAVICWNEDIEAIAGVPQGRFDAVSSAWGGVRHGHSCAVRDDKTIVCWGNNQQGQSDAPSGAFTAVAAGGAHSCALDDDKAMVCWGDNVHGQSEAPEGAFVTVTAGANHSCGIREDQTIVCWGDNSAGQLDAPSGPHSGLSVGGWHVCAIGADQTASCWGYNSNRQADAPAGRFAAISAGSLHTCGLREDGTIECNGFGATGWANFASGDDGVAVQAVYAVPDGETPVSSRREGIADTVSAAQNWFRSQTGGRHPVFVRHEGSIDVKAIRVGPLPTAAQHRNGETMATEIRATLGLPPYVSLLIFAEGKFESFNACGWKSLQFVMVPIANCDSEPKLDTRWPYGASYLIGHELTHLLGATPDCAPNNDGSSHVDDDNGDVIWLGSGNRDWDNLMLDVGHDDYFMHGRDDCFDIANHPLLRNE